MKHTYVWNILTMYESYFISSREESTNTIQFKIKTTKAIITSAQSWECFLPIHRALKLILIADSFLLMMDLESETFILLNNVKSSYYCFNLFTKTSAISQWFSKKYLIIIRTNRTALYSNIHACGICKSRSTRHVLE